eukprot:UN25145
MFVNPMLKQRIIKKSSEFCRLCNGPLSILIEKSKLILSKFEMSDNILEVFNSNDFTALIKIYTVYLKFYENVRTFIVDVKKTRKGRQFFDKVKRPLDSLLTCPAQRPCRFKLLLDQVLKRTPKNHPNYKELTQTCNRVESLVNFINEKLATERLRALENQITGNKKMCFIFTKRSILQ